MSNKWIGHWPDIAQTLCIPFYNLLYCIVLYCIVWFYSCIF